MHATPIESSKVSLQQDQTASIMATMDAGSTSDAFDGSAEPIIYMSDNRMPVMIEFNCTIIYIVFIALLFALLFILPGVRKTKLTSFLGLLTLLTVGASILLAIEGSYWLTGTIQIYEAPYSSLSSETITGKLEINIGLSSANVTLIGKLTSLETANANRQHQQQEIISKTVDYNERFNWDHPERMANEHVEALRKGLPYPILTATEFLGQDSDGFNWTRQLRQAGKYSSLVLYISLASWCLMSVIMCVLPVYLPHMMQITGALMMSSVWIYTLLIHSPKSFAFQLGGNSVEFAFGYTYVTTFVSGALSMFAGVLLFALQMSHPHEQFTIMDSEQYVNDHKALYSINLANHPTNKLNLKGDKSNMEKNSSNVPSRNDSVIIPMADIEENFKPNTSSSS